MCKRIEIAGADRNGNCTDGAFNVSLHRSQEGCPHTVCFESGYPFFTIAGFGPNEGSPCNLSQSVSCQFDGKNTFLNGGAQVIRCDWINRYDGHNVRDCSEYLSAFHME